MSLDFNPLIWFVCRYCRQVFPDTDKLKQHKLRRHSGECSQIKCIVFEERLLERQWIPTDHRDIFPAEACNCRSDCWCHLNSSVSVPTEKVVVPLNLKPNPYVSLIRLTSQEIDASRRKNPRAPGPSSRGKKRTINCLKPSQCPSPNNCKKSKQLLHPKDDIHKTFDPKINEITILKKKVRDATSIYLKSEAEFESELPQYSNTVEVQTSVSGEILYGAESDTGIGLECKVEVHTTNSNQNSDTESIDPLKKDSDSDEDYQIPHDHDANSDTSDDENKTGLARANPKLKAKLTFDPNPVPEQEPDIVEEPSVPLVQWLALQEHEQSLLPQESRNIILLNPTPTISEDFFDVSGENPVSCKLCSTQLETDMELRNHVENCWWHNKQGHLYCHKCDRSYYNRKNLSIHIKTKHPLEIPENIETGEISDESDPADLELDIFQWLKKQKENPNEVNVILLEPDPTEAEDQSIQFPVKCGLCRHILKNEATLKSHVKLCYRFNKDRHRYCIPCKRLFKEYRGLQNHNYKEHSGNSTSRLSCSVCYKRFSSDLDLKLHKKSLHTFLKNIEKSRKIQKNTVISTEVLDVQKEKNSEGFLADWLKFQRQMKYLDGTDTVILLDPEPRSNGDEGHLNEVNETNSISCRLCSTKLVSVFAVQIHVNKCWQQNKAKHCYCVKCEKSFDSPKKLQKHKTEEHSGDDGESSPTLKCLFADCGKEICTETDFRNHVESHKDPNFKPFQCQLCSLTFKYKKRLNQHQTVHGRQTLYKCPVCSKSFNSKVTLIEHEQTHTGLRPFQCTAESCEKAFPTRNALFCHRQRNHAVELGLKTFNCTESGCNRKFGLKNALTTHREMFHMADYRPFQCTHKGCTKTFKRRNHLTEHLVKHKGEKPHQCEECGQTFLHPWDLAKHQRSHLEGVLIDRPMCHLCSNTFANEWNLKKHLKSHERVKLPTKSPKRVRIRIKKGRTN